jgi:hypothetical protein
VSAMLAMEVMGTPGLDSVRYYLRQWVSWRRGWFPHLGAPSSVPYIDAMVGSRPMDGYDDPDGDDARIHAETMRQVDQAIERDLTADHKHAIIVVYMREAGPAVWRSNRKPMSEIRSLCWQAEQALIPLLRRRDLPV